MYEQLVVDGAIKTAPLGGVDLTRYMGDMLLSCKVLLQCPFGYSSCLLGQIIARMWKLHPFFWAVRRSLVC